MDHLEPPVSPDDISIENPGRRKLLKVLAAGGGAVAASSLLPSQWIKPVIEVGYLPVHAQASPTVEPTVEPTIEPIVYSISCSADSTNNENFIDNITATVSATGGTSVNNIEVQYLAETIPAGGSTTPVTGFTNSSGTVNLGNFEFCPSGLNSDTYQIVVSFVDTSMYGNDTCILGPYTSPGC